MIKSMPVGSQLAVKMRVSVPCAIGILLTLTALPSIAEEAEESQLRAIQEAREELARAREDLVRATEALSLKLGQESRGGQRQIEVIRLHKRPIVGLLMVNDDDRDGGALIAGVTPGGPAEKAGIRSGDRLLAVDGRAVEGSDTVAHAHELLAEMQEGTEYQLLIETRTGDRKTIPVTAAVLDHAPPIAIHEFQSIIEPFSIGDGIHIEIDDLRDSLKAMQSSEFFSNAGEGFNVWQFGWRWNGLELASMNPDLGRYFSTDEGVLVLSFDGDDRTLTPGDVILSVNGVTVRTPQETMQELGRTETGEMAQLEIMRDHGRQAVDVAAPRARTFKFRTP